MLQRVSISLCLVGVFLAGCATLYNPATGRKEFILIDSKTEASLGKGIDEEIRKKYPVVTAVGMQERVDRIGGAIAAVSDRQDLNYTFEVINDDSYNAFTTPGGYVYVHSGLIDAATDDELAAVIAHEIGHVAARHSVKQLQSAMGYQLVMSIALGLTGQQDMSQAADLAYSVVSLGYSRQDELLADRLAVKYSRKAGYNPYGLVTFFQKLKQHVAERKEPRPIEFLSSHPDLDTRIQRALELIQLEEDKGSG